ncbi:unnamed protein product [Sphagnum jensenii]
MAILLKLSAPSSKPRSPHLIAQPVAKPATDAETIRELVKERDAAKTAVGSALELCIWICNEISRRQYEADELGKGLAAWEGFDDCMFDGRMASYRDEFEAIVGYERKVDKTPEPLDPDRLREDRDERRRMEKEFPYE